MAVVRRKKQGVPRTNMRLPTDLYDFADQYAKENGYASAVEVCSQAVRELRERDALRKERKAMFDAWVKAGRQWPPPPGLMAAMEKAQSQA